MANKKLCVCDSDRKFFSEMTNEPCNACGGIVVTNENLIYNMLQWGDISFPDFLEWKQKNDWNTHPEAKELALKMKASFYERVNGAKLQGFPIRFLSPIDDFMPGVLTPEDAKRFEEMWECAKPKFDRVVLGPCPIFYGTGGVSPEEKRDLRETFNDYEADPYLDWDNVPADRIVDVRKTKLR